MALIVGALPHSEWLLLTPLLEAMGWEPEQAPPSEGWYSSVNGAADFSGGDVCLLLHSRPERCIANALDQGTELRAAVALWQTTAEQMLGIYRQLRAQAVLVDVKSVCEAPQALLEWLTANQPAFNERAYVASQQSIRLGYIEDSDSLEHNLNLLVATQAVWQSSSIQRLLADIEACTVPVTSTASTNTPMLIAPHMDVISTQLQLQSAQKRRFETRFEGKLEGLTEAHKAEIGVLEARVQGLERERGDYQAKAESLSEELEALRQKWTEAEQQASQVIADQEAALAKKDERLGQYAQMVARYERKLAYHASEMEKFALDKHKDIVTFREKLSRAEREVHGQSALVDALMREREQLHAKVASLRTSWLSWLTFPARWVYYLARKVGRLFRGRSHRRAVRIIEQSDLFDATWYARQYPDVIESGANPAEHYARYGAFEGRDPGPGFSSAKYLKRNRDIAESGINPLVHYELHGKHEGRSAR